MKPLYYILLRIVCIQLLILIFSSYSLKSQNSKSLFQDLKIINDSLDPHVRIKFNSSKEISNVLMFIVDNEGNTIFLENKHHFSGEYSKSIDLSKYKKGNFTLTLICDDEKLKKKLVIK